MTRHSKLDLEKRRWNPGTAVVLLAGLVVASLPGTAADLRIPQGRFEFATIPEHAFVAGLAESAQLGIWQLDPANPWPAGEQTRASGWKSRFPTRLVDAASGRPIDGLGYDGQTGELRYGGEAARDFNVRLERTDAPVASNVFRIRVLKPTHVFGDGAEATNREQRWGAKVCEPPMTFAACRKSFKRAGGSDAAPLVVHITPGDYQGDFFLGNQRFVYVLGDPEKWPQLNRDSLDVGRAERATFRNLALNATRLGSPSVRDDAPSVMLLSNIRQCCEIAVRNGVSNPHGVTKQPWTVTVWNFEGSGMGDPGNTVHQFYIEGRPQSTFELNNVRILGTRGSSAIKTTMQNVAVRHSLLSVSETPGDVSAGSLMHTPIDVPAVSNLIVYGNRFLLYRAPTAKNKPGRQGVLAGAIFLRLRKPGLKGSDIPAYPDLSWDPPRSSQTTMSSPGEGWSAGPETYVSDDFWRAVRKRPVTDPANPLTFKHFVGFNRFEQLPGSLPVTVLRDDGTRPAEPVNQFGPGRPLRVPPAWVERSVTFLAGNHFEGFGQEPRLELRSSEHMKDAAPDANWPRSKEEDFPHAITVEDELPAWFKL